MLVRFFLYKGFLYAEKTLSIILLGFAIILLSAFLYFLFNPVIYKGGFFNKVVHAEYKEKFNILDIYKCDK